MGRDPVDPATPRTAPPLVPGAWVEVAEGVLVRALERQLAAARAGRLEPDVDPARWQEVVLPTGARPVAGPLTLSPGARAVVLEPWPQAHTTCDLVVHVPDVDVWLVGDVVEESGAPSFEVDSDPVGWAQALENLLARLTPHSLVVPGHGAVVGKDFVAAQSRTMTTVARTLAAGHARGAAERTLVRALGEASGWPGPTLRAAARAFLAGRG